MTIRKGEIERIAALASVIGEDTDMEQLSRDIDAIVEFVSRLSAVASDTSHATYRPGPDRAPLRDDTVDPIRLTRPIGEFAPQVRDAFFLVPRLEGVSGE